jgi:hypothetical protein
MKYIRTKDGIFSAEVEWTSKPPKNIAIKRADTIEELCDEFVGISDDKPQMLRFVPYACAQYWNGGVYGAIWTDKGLIYVAKMNDKGELELL